MSVSACFLALLHSVGVPLPVAEYRFHPVRMWRWDYAWPDHRLALEQDGGVWTRGRHGRGSGIVKDHEKRNAGALLGWRLLLVTPKQLATFDTARMIGAALALGCRVTPPRPGGVGI